MNAVREVMQKNGITTFDAIQFIAMHSTSPTRGAPLRRVVSACAAYIKETRVGTVQGKIIAVCSCTDEWFPTKEELQIDGMKTRGLVCPDCSEKDRYKLHDFEAYVKEGQ